MTTDTLAPALIGLFDIMQVDPLRGDDVPTMYARRLDDLELAESLGFDVAFAAERHFLPQFAAAAATAWLAAASQRTRRIRLGAMGYTLPIKSPVELAESISTLDILARGRLEVGFGIGHRIEELVALGVDPRQRIVIFQERLALLRALWTGGQVSFERDDLVLREVAVSPLPLQEPHPPLWYAGTEPVAAQWMGENGLGLALGFKPVAQLVPAVAAFRKGRDARSPELASIDPPRPLGSIALMRAVVVGESDERVRREVVDDLLRLDEAITGEQPESTRPQRREAASAQFDQMVANEVMIAGSAETVAAGIRRQRADVPFDLFLANVYAMGASHERVQESLRLLGGAVREQLSPATVG